MLIWSTEIKELELLFTSIKGRFPEIEKELEQLLETKDANVVMLYSRRCLEVIITDLCESELKRPRKTEPLKGIIDKLNKEEKVPSHIITSMDHLNSLSSFGAHPKEYNPEQVRPILLNLATIFKWYLKYKDIQIEGDANSEGEKYESNDQEDSFKNTPKPNKRLVLLLSGILLVGIVVVALLVFNIIDDRKQSEELEKSIAVLPFVNDSQDEENTYFINGIMEEVLLNLQAIKDLRVPGRTSVEQYRKMTKSIPEIAKELGVSYIVEGSGQKYGNTIRLRIQLLEGGKDKHLWGESYEQVIENPEDIFRIQNRIAVSIAAELKAIILPEEKQLIEKTPTNSLIAYDFFQRGREEHQKYWSDNGNKKALEKAEDLYYKALKYDSTFARAYSGLAIAYWDKHYSGSFFSEDFLDSALILIDIALSYDDQLSEAYLLKGSYYQQTGKTEQADKEFDKAIKYNPNDWMPYYYKAFLYQFDDLVKVLENAQKAASLHRGSQLPEILTEIYWAYRNAGFTEKSKYYAQEILKLDGDSAGYYISLAGIERDLTYYGNEIEFLKKAYTIDSNYAEILSQIGSCYMYLRQYEESLEYYKKFIKIQEAQGALVLWDMQRIGYAYWINGYKKEAEYYFEKQIENSKNEIQLGRLRSEQFFAFYDLAGVYAFMGEKGKAYDNLRFFNQKKIMHNWMVWLIKTDPLFNSIRNEPEFQQIVWDVETKYQAEHERVKKWLEEQGE